MCLRNIKFNCPKGALFYLLNKFSYFGNNITILIIICLLKVDHLKIN